MNLVSHTLIRDSRQKPLFDSTPSIAIARFQAAGWPRALEPKVPLAKVEVEVTPGGPQPKTPWRKLEIRVTPTSIYTCWEGEGSTKEVGLREWSERLSKSFAFLKERGFDLDAVPPVLHLRGSLGLYVRRGSALFRNVVLEALDDNP